jgi:GNAT superfamily N-acetyltransferase
MGCHHHKLPTHSTLLSGRVPRFAESFQSAALQIWYNHTDRDWVGAGELLHFHLESDECFVVLRGQIDVRVDGQIHSVAAGEFCCFPAGQAHGIAAVHPPVETLMIRAPSVADKVYEDDRLVVEAWPLEHPRRQEVDPLIDAAGQADLVAFSAAWHMESHLLVALVDGKPAGFLRYVVQPIGPEIDCAPLHHAERELREAKGLAFYVLDDFRRRGLGRRLQAEPLVRARAAGCWQVRSYSAAHHVANHQLKLSMGFAANRVNDDRGEGINYIRTLGLS